MKKIGKAFGLFTALLVIFGGEVLVSCSSDDDGGGGSDKKQTVYSISAAESEVTLAPSGSKTVSIATNGTMLKPASSDETVATATLDNSAKTITIKAASTITETKTAVITITLDEDSTKKAEIKVTVDPNAEVTEATYLLSLSLDEDAAAKASKIEVYYGADSGTYETVAADYTAGSTTAAASLKLSLANSYGWFNNIKVTVYGADGGKVSTEIDKDNFDSGTAGAAIKISLYTETTMTLKLSFSEGADVAKVSLLYYPANGETSAGETLSADVTDSSASFTLSKSYASTWGYNAALTAYNSNGDDVTSGIASLSSTDSTFGGNAAKSWWAFVADGTTTVSVTYSTEQWQTLVTKDSFALGTSPVEVISKADVKGYTFTALKIEVSGVADSSDSWLTMTAGTAWNGQLSLSKAETADSDGTYTYSGTASSSNLESYASDGIGLAGTAQDSSVKVVVYYQGEFDEEAHNAAAKTSSTILVDALAVDLTGASWSNYVTVVEAAKFADYTIAQIDISLALTDSLASGNIAVGKGSSEWGVNLSWPSGEETAFTASITSSELIASIKSSGLTIGGDYAGKAALTVTITYESGE